MLFLLLSILIATSYGTPIDGIEQTNLLFIIFDDLRPELQVYGKKHMITPNFDRLAARSVIFDHAYSQVAVCNPSRDSLLTGLRPDTLGNFAFQTSFKPHLLFPTQLSRSGYKTSSFGKVLHWDGNDKEVWNTEQYWGNWYDNQNLEWDTSRSTVWPDKHKEITSFYDYDFAARAIDNLKRMATAKSDYFMTAIGFKLPHTLLHFPHKYFDMYRSHFESNFMNATARANYTLFPASCPAISYRCCAGESYRYMKAEGAAWSVERKELKAFNTDLSAALPARMHKELMWGYSAAITFVDTQLGRLLDAVDELKLWNNLTIVLTADHGMHNGEKGIWEKWTLFDEATRVPLMIYHPLTPFGGQHYAEPVELVDIFPTIIDLLNPPYDKEKVYNARRSRHPRKYVPLAGKSLGAVILGLSYLPRLGSYKADPSLAEDFYTPMQVIQHGHSRKSKKVLHRVPLRQVMPVHKHQYALSQIWRCSPKVLTSLNARNATERKIIKKWFLKNRKEDRLIQFLDCDMRNTTAAIINEEDSFMGYSMRTREFRYTIWVPFDRLSMMPMWENSSASRTGTSIKFLTEELYDHRKENIAADLGTKETINVANDAAFSSIRTLHRQRTLNFLKTQMLYKSQYRTPTQKSQTAWQQAWNSMRKSLMP